MNGATPSVEALIQRVPRSLGTYAPVLEEIQTALTSPQCSLATVAEAIEKDPDLTARLLRLGNSSFYGFSTRLATVGEAMSLLGIQQVQDLIVASSIVEQFSGVPADFVDMESFWRHSLACGIGARVIATEARLPKPDKFFVAGLLHDVGRLVLFLQAPAAAREVIDLYRREPMLLREAETRVLGYSHQQVGEQLLRAWQYPLNLITAVGYHHNPASCSTARDEAAVVHIADYLANAMQLGSSGERFVPPLQTAAWERFGLSLEVLPRMMETIDDHIEGVQEVFLSTGRSASKP